MPLIIKGSVLCVFIAIVYYYCNSKPPITKPAIFAAPGWEKVAAVFRKQVESGWQEGGALSVYHKGELVIEAVGGYADDYIFLEWTNQTVSQYFSVTKGMSAVVMAMLVDRGLLDYNKPVSHYWPEFAQNGKEHITVEQLLSHQAGLPVMDEPYEYLDVLYDDQKMSRILASQRPLWTPGEGFGYHAITVGLYESQIVKRVDPKGRSLSMFFDEEVAKPYNIDAFIGLPKKEHYRCARNVYAGWHSIQDVIMYYMFNAIMWFIQRGDSLMKKVISQPSHIFLLDRHFNQPDWRQIPSPSTQGFGTATALAKFYGIAANGGKMGDRKLLDEKYVRLLLEPLTNGTDMVLGMNFALGRGASVLYSPKGTKVFGVPGNGGQAGKCDPENKLGIAYITNHMGLYVEDPKFLELEQAVYDTLDQL